ncbi:MAG: 2-amino-4-hydroxy-6-hydroxymethyldihydropteridine diphosphokinase [Pseudomonadota bacterium]
MTGAFVAIGSNIDPERNIPAALALLRREVELKAISTFYRTEPAGAPGTPGFFNGVVKIETGSEPRDLKLFVLRGIEKIMGRVRSADKYAPRTIDLDLLLYGARVISEEGLVIPDPDICTRAFVAAPLLELEPGLVLPDSGRRLEDVVKSLPAGSMVPLGRFTRTLRAARAAL